MKRVKSGAFTVCASKTAVVLRIEPQGVSPLTGFHPRSILMKNERIYEFSYSVLYRGIHAY
jgi:hypothetical protein